MARYLIHCYKDRRWYVDKYLIPSMLKQDIDKSDIEVFEDDGTLVEVVGVQAEEKYLNEDGTIKLDEVGIISYDPYGHGYYVVGDKVGNAFQEGKKLM